MKFISFNNFENNLNNNSNVGMGILTAIAIILFAISIFGLIGNFILWEPVSLWFLRVCSLPIIIMVIVGHLNYRIEAKNCKLILDKQLLPANTKSLTNDDKLNHKFDLSLIPDNLIEYNNFLGSNWVRWDLYKKNYYENHPNSIGFIDEYPRERPHMFRTIQSVTRVEIITSNGRGYVNKLQNGSYYQLSLQDDDRTLKLFETLKEIQCE